MFKIENSFRPRLVYSLTLLLIIAGREQALADSFEITPLWFGRFAIADNSVVSTMRIRHDGRNPIATNRMFPIEFGTAGEYQLSNFPAFTPLVVTITSNNLTTAGPTEHFTVGNFTFEDVTTDANGEAILTVGATLSTTGSGTPYVSAEYSTIYNIVFSY